MDLKLLDSDITYFPNFLNIGEADFYFEHFRREVPWQQDDIKVFGKVYAQPRLTALYGNNGKPYSYSNITMQPNDFTRELLEIKTKVEKGNARLVNKKIVHKPFFRVMEDKVYVHFIKPDNKRVTINIYNSNGDIVNTESFINRSGALRSFNFSDAQKDTYKVGVLANEISYYESIEIK